VRSFTVADVPAYAEIVADPRVTKYLDDGSPHTFQEADAYIRDCIERDHATGISRYAVIRKRENDLIGFCGFKALQDYVDFGWRYAFHAWGQGYATEAALRIIDYGLIELGLRNMAAGAYVENVASIKIIQRLGFKHITSDRFYGRDTVRHYQSPLTGSAVDSMP
jgi:RimJ/RimL family protein N-acetyltransferase